MKDSTKVKIFDFVMDILKVPFIIAGLLVVTVLFMAVFILTPAFVFEWLFNLEIKTGMGISASIILCFLVFALIRGW